MSRQSLETLPCLDVPDANALVELQADRQTVSQTSLRGCRPAADTAEAAHRSRHHQVGLRVEVTAEDVVAVTFESLQALPLQAETRVSLDFHTTTTQDYIHPSSANNNC